MYAVTGAICVLGLEADAGKYCDPLASLPSADLCFRLDCGAVSLELMVQSASGTLLHIEICWTIAEPTQWTGFSNKPA